LLGHEPISAGTIEDFVEAQRTYTEHPAVWREFTSAVAVLFPFKLGFVLMAPVILGVIFGSSHPAVWAALLTTSLAVLVFRRYGHFVVTRTDNRCDASESG
jgi:hypothetical protein